MYAEQVAFPIKKKKGVGIFSIDIYAPPFINSMSKNVKLFGNLDQSF